MWEMSENHCCASCSYSRSPGSLVETSAPPACAFTRIGEEDLFPLAQSRLCLFCRESLGEPSVQAVLVRPDGRCDAYHCDEERYTALHGAPPVEDEDRYALYAPVQSLAGWQPFL